MTLAPLPAPQALRLLDGTELIGPVAGSALAEPPCLVRRPDGQVVQLSRLLFVLARHMDGDHDAAAIAARAGEELGLRITPEQVVYVAEQKLHPLGLVPAADGSPPALERVDALMALRLRVGVVPTRVVRWLANLLQPLFLPPIVIAVVACIVGFDVWLLAVHGPNASVGRVISQPVLALALLVIAPVSLAFHEFGHAAACRYGGASPGRIGIGIYIVWPVFFSDVTDSYRLSRAGRLRTDLGGVYFNLVFGVAGVTAYVITAFEPLLLVAPMQQMIVLEQFVPWIRLDGYHVISDFIGVSDLFARIKPVLLGLVPGRPLDPRVAELKPWARRAVTTWVLTTVAVLSAGAAYLVANAPAYLHHAWTSLQLQLHAFTRATASGHVVEAIGGGAGTVMLLLPVAGLTLTYLLVCRGMGARVALAQARACAAATAGDQVPRQSRRVVPDATEPAG